MKRKPLSQDFARIGTDWRPAMVRIGRTQGVASILEVTLADGADVGKSFEARQLPRRFSRAKRHQRKLAQRALRKATATPCAICGNPCDCRSRLCASCATYLVRAEERGEDKMKRALELMIEKGES